LKININSLAPGINRLELPISKNSVSQEMVNLAKDGTLTLKIDNKETSLFCEAKACVSVLMECDRCLKEFKRNLNFEFTFVAKINKGGEYNESDDNIIFFGKTDSELDIKNIIFQELSVNLPMKSICSERCKGLCLNCGCNLNEKMCNCTQSSCNPALNALLKLKGSK